MTTMQKEMLDAVRKVGEFGTPIAYAEACEEVAKRYVEKALRDASSESFKNKQGLVMQKVQGYYVTQWLFENGVTGEVNS